jgi:hypothetical protein
MDDERRPDLSGALVGKNTTAELMFAARRS